MLARLVTIASVLLAAASAGAATPVDYRVRAQIDDHVRAELAITVDVDDDGTLRLWFYADRLAVAPSALDQHNARWIFPREVDVAELEARFRIDGRDAQPSGWERHEPGHAEGRDFRGADALFEGLAPGRHRVEVELLYRLPERFGRLGRVRDRRTLTGPWYPLVVDRAGERDATRFRVPHDVEVDAPGLQVWDGEQVREGHARWQERTWFVPVVAAEELHLRTAALPHGRTLRVLSHRALYEPPPPDAPGLFALRDIARVDVVGQIERVAADAVRTLRALEVPAGASRDLTVALVPSRTELAGVAPGMVCASDRLYEILPQEDVLAFHDRALARAVFRAMVAPLVDSADQPADRTWSEDLRAVLLVDLDILRRQDRNLSARDLIGWAGFHPLVDQLLYAPQVSFVDIWFGIAEPDPFRDAPERARAPTARGRRLVEAARDALSEEHFRAWSQALLRERRGARASLLALDADHERLLDDWLGAPATELNYRLVGVASERRGGEGYRHVVTVERVLAPGSAPRIEPVEVRVETDADETETERWMADLEADRGQVVFETRGALVDVQVDPRGRVVQSPEVSGGHPRRDDTNRLPFRPPILQGFNLALGATEGAFIGLVDFAIRRRYDLENSVSLRLDTGPRAVGALLRYRRGIGRKRDNNSRIGFLMGGVEVDRLRADFSDEEEGGWRGAVLLQGGFSTLRWFLDPRRGESLAGSVRAGIVRRDDGSRTWTLTPSLRGNLTRPLGLRGAIVLVGSAAYALGDPLPAERPGLGGRFGLRGYQFAELVGRGVAFAVAELRFTPTIFSDLSINGLNLLWLREIQLAVFGGIGGVFEASDGRDAVLGAEVGGGIRVHFEYGGVQPAVLALDLAVPLVRSAESRAALPPVTTILAFEQFF